MKNLVITVGAMILILSLLLSHLEINLKLHQSYMDYCIEKPERKKIDIKVLRTEKGEHGEYYFITC